MSSTETLHKNRVIHEAPNLKPCQLSFNRLQMYQNISPPSVQITKACSYLVIVYRSYAKTVLSPQVMSRWA